MLSNKFTCVNAFVFTQMHDSSTSSDPFLYKSTKVTRVGFVCQSSCVQAVFNPRSPKPKPWRSRAKNPLREERIHDLKYQVPV